MSTQLEKLDYKENETAKEIIAKFNAFKSWEIRNR